MSLTTDIQAIMANGSLTDEQKRQQVYALKGGAIRQFAAQVVGQQFTVGVLTITITEPPVLNGNGSVSIWVSATRSGAPIVFPPDAQPFIFVNPPVIHQGAENPLAAVKQMLADAVGRY